MHTRAHRGAKGMQRDTKAGTRAEGVCEIY